MIEKLTSAIYNDIISGLSGITSNPAISMEQLEDDVVDERLQIIKEYSLKNLIPKRDLLLSINCIDLDCKSLDKCPCGSQTWSPPVAHFEIPQIVNDLASQSVEYLGSIDRLVQFKVYTSTSWRYHKYLRRGADKPFAYIETVPNENNFYDVWVYNVPLLKKASIIAIFKDPRQLRSFDCCQGEEIDNHSFLSNEIKRRLVEKKLRPYRQLLQVPQPNNQVPR